MNRKVYLSDLEWTQMHDDIGGVKGKLIFFDSISYEEYIKLSNSGCFLLTTVDSCKQQQRIDKAIEILESDNQDAYLVYKILKGEDKE